VKILAAHDGGSGCTWYRVYVPLKAVNEHSEDTSVSFCSALAGDEITGDPLLTSPGQAEGADVFLAQRVNSYKGLGMWRRMVTPQRRTVYENDDDVWHIDPSNPAYKHYEEGGDIREAVQRYCDTASLITVTTPYLGDLHREMSPHVPVTVLPNYIPEWVLGLASDDRQGHPRVGWAGGSSHKKDLAVPGNSLARFMKRFPQWHCWVNGVDFRREAGTPFDRTFHVPWLPVCMRPKLYYRAIDFDIGIAPLAGTEFNRAKSPVKALEYMARGAVVIASDVEPYRRFIRHGENGFLVKREHEWLNYLSLLAGDDELRFSMKAAALETARANTIEGHWREWEDTYKALFPVGWQFQGGKA
jgi:glycosyltransferase involved in cell wall biosynthesis